MRKDIPSTTDMLEEQVAKAVNQIAALKLSGFKSALYELIRLHRFMLLTYETKDAAGISFNYAELTEGGGRRTHEDWIGQYRRLFEVSVSAISNDSSFAKSAAHIPNMLIEPFDRVQLSDAVIKGILDLAPMLAHRLEAWVTSRTLSRSDGNVEGGATRLELVGSDAKEYEGVIVEFVGSWEQLISAAYVNYSVRSESGLDSSGRWERYRRCWNYVWEHLVNSAYLVAVSTWNEDHIAASLYADSFVRWPRTLDHQHENAADYYFESYFLFPDLLSLDWAQASAIAVECSPNWRMEITPDDLFKAIVRRAHGDLLFLTTALLNSWVSKDKQLTDLGINVARDLLDRRQIEDGTTDRGRITPPNFLSVGMQIMRLELANAPYASRLNEAVRQMDQMTERTVISGRVYTPTTLHEMNQLLSEQMAVWALLSPESGDGGLREPLLRQWERLASQPNGYDAISEVSEGLARMLKVMDEPADSIGALITKISRKVDQVEAAENLERIVKKLHTDAEEFLAQKLKSASVDISVLDKIRKSAESELLSVDKYTEFFVGFSALCVDSISKSNICEFRLTDIPKGSVTSPRMSKDQDVGREFARRLAARFANRIWGQFTEQSRIEVQFADNIFTPGFWDQLQNILDNVGPNPVLVVPNSGGVRTLLKTRYAGEGQYPRVVFDPSKPLRDRGSFRGTVNGVEVFTSAFPDGKAWLFSAKKLRRVALLRRNADSHIIDLGYEPSNEVQGALAAKFEFEVSWSENPVYEIVYPDTAR